ncbi:BMP family protein [Microcoleus vaginatus DQ-U2]|uniref:BMP family ABC transporter substrate-binding protein n=1 Tax=Microcoleus vaginatus TaxID=119532 RepID=UPI00168380D9|nr:BMP family protein [Microcoleus sp. FACHB-DQ6]
MKIGEIPFNKFIGVEKVTLLRKAIMRIQSFLKQMTLAALALFFAIGCSRSAPNVNSSPEASTSGSFSVAMLTTGSKDNHSWDQACFEGLNLVKNKFNAEVDITDSIDGENSEATIRKYAQSGYDLVIACSGAYLKVAEKVAKEFPRTKFALITTHPGNNRNLGAVAFRSGEVGYLTGALAAIKTKSHKVGYIVGAAYPVYKEEEALFRRGVKATNSSVQASTAFLNSWSDTEKAIKVATDMVASGVDVLAINADEAGFAALKAVTQKPGVFVIGWSKDQYELAPGKVITSVLQDIPNLVLNVAVLTQQGRWEGKLYKFGLKEKIYDFAPFRGTLTSQEEDSFKIIREAVTTGKIDVSP